MRNPFKIVDSRQVYENPWIRLREDRVIRPDGTPGLFGVIDLRPGSSVLPIDDESNVWLVREYKYAVGRPSLEVVSGGQDEGETPLQTAQRALREEAGLTADQWTDLGKIDPLTTMLSSANYLFLARGLQSATREPDGGEVIDTVKLPFIEAVEMVMRSEITHAASCAVLLKAAYL